MKNINLNSVNTLSFAALYHESHQPPPLEHINFKQIQMKTYELHFYTLTHITKIF
jgi:hypothetical protein